MKKLIYAFMALAAVLVSCSDKDDAEIYKFEGSQWVSEIMMEELGCDIKGECLIDMGATSQGKMAFAIIAEENSKKGLNEGDIVIIENTSYTYTPTDESGAKGIIQAKGEQYSIEFINENTIKFYITPEIYYIFSRVSNNYSLSGAKDINDLTISLIPSKTSDWAGGVVTFELSNGDNIKYLTYDIITVGADNDASMPTALTNADNTPTLTLGLYKNNGIISDAEISLKASDENGNEYECIVTSKAWSPAVYKEESNGYFTEQTAPYIWERGSSCWIGAKGAGEEIEYTGNNNSFKGITYSIDNPLFETYGNKENKVGIDLPNSNTSTIITYSYGEYSQAIEIEIQ